tara:strand:+ start:555 stop:1013 length:459 start_codon:yes stop_codon:yes gene_type:complete
MNNISVVGRLTKDVTVAKTGDNWVIRGTIADNFYKPSAEDNTGVNFVNFSRFVRNEPKPAFTDRLKKGSSVAIVGRLEVSSRKDENSGTTYQNLSVLVNDMTSFSANQTTEHTEHNTTSSSNTTSGPTATATATATKEPATADAGGDEDLPF